MTSKPFKKGRARTARPTGRSRAARPAPVRLDDEAKEVMKQLMEVECVRKPFARRIAAGEMTLEQFKMRFPEEYARSYRAKNLLEQNSDMTRARAFWLAEDNTRLEAMKDKQIRTFATHTGLSQELSRQIATGQMSLGQLAKTDKRWEFIWARARTRMASLKESGHPVSPMEAIRWARGDFGLPFGPAESEDEIERIGSELHEKYPFMKKRHTRRMARFELDLQGLAQVAPANCGWGVRALELWERYPGQHRKFIRLMAMMGLDDDKVEKFIEQTDPARAKYRELAGANRRYRFHRYGDAAEGILQEDDNPFSWQLADEDGTMSKQSKLQVLFLCPADAYVAIQKLAGHDNDVAKQSLDAAFKVGERLEQQLILDKLEHLQKSDKTARFTLRNGMVFEGKPDWYSPFEVQVRMSNNAWVMILFHGIYALDVL
jgi:hypothetical protein